MENSETRERIITLGKALVEELGLEPGVDTLSRWMAHYVAEQITIAENAVGDEKTQAEQRCFETILKLWHRRASLPSGSRPLENFKPILRTLTRLDPENSRPFYYSFHHAAESEVSSENVPDEVQKYIEFALGLDEAARVLIKSVFSQAARCAVDEKTLAWLKNAANLTDIDDILIVTHLLPADLDDGEDKENFEQIRQEQERLIRSAIDKLDAFVELSSLFRDELIVELDKLSQKNTHRDDVNESK